MPNAGICTNTIGIKQYSALSFSSDYGRADICRIVVSCLTNCLTKVEHPEFNCAGDRASGTNTTWMASQGQHTVPLWMIEIDTKVFAGLVGKMYPYTDKVYKLDELLTEGQGVVVDKDILKKHDIDAKAKATLVKRTTEGWTVKFVKQDDDGEVKTWEKEVGKDKIEGKIHQTQQIHELLNVIKTKLEGKPASK